MEIVNGVLVQGIGELVDGKAKEYQAQLALLDPSAIAAQQQSFTSSLASFVLKQFRINKDARRNSLVDEEMLDSLRAYNGEYSANDLALIRQTGGSEIYINIVGVKARAAASWIRDIQLPAKMNAWSVEPTPVADLPDNIKDTIRQKLDAEFGSFTQEFTSKPQLREPPQQPQQAGVSSAQQFSPTEGNTSAQPQQAAGAARTLKEFNQAKRDIEDMVLAEINKIARHEMKKMERQIADQLAEGDWVRALSDFIDDFVVFPTAFLKGPIVCKDSSLSYLHGQPVVTSRYVYKNKRISPFDMYPSPNSTGINDGSNLIEHCRFIRRELLDMKGMPGYDNAAIDKALSTYGKASVFWLDTGLESDRASDERRGTEWEANTDVIHGLHFHGSIPASELKQWGMKDPAVLAAGPEDEFEVEVILAGEYVIKCVLNSHPLKRRPYYKASYQTRPGSFWGRSLASLMSDIQRMCNAAARALANNMGLASGPQVEVYVDRLADNSPITSIQPFKIWQLTSDPTGAGGRAIQFTQPTSNAAELLKVYQEFEIRADDATGIPRYSYGNERVGGAAMTATGLAMLLESASKAIKDCVRNIDEEVIVPRVEMQFYWNVATNPNNFYSGDPKVVARGSSALTMKGAEQMRRNEFLQITANPLDQQIMGLAGRAELLRSIAEDLNLSEDLIPSRLELMAQQEKASQAESQKQEREFQLEEMKHTTGLKATEMQIQGQMQMHQQTQQARFGEMELKQWVKKIEAELTLAKIDAEQEADLRNSINKLKQEAYAQEREDERFNTEVALKLRRGEGI